MRKQKGFSLIELLIVVAIILIIAAIAIPNLLRARVAANESSAAGSIRTLNTSEVSYWVAWGGYSPDLISMGCNGVCPNPPTAAKAGFIDDVLAKADAGNGKAGYFFNAVGSASAGSTVNNLYGVVGNPITPGSTGVRSFCSFEDGVVRAQVGVIADRAACAAPVAALNN